MLVLRHGPGEHLGRFAAVLERRGWGVRILDVAVEPIVDDVVASADAVIVLGGAVGVYQSELFPYLADEVAALRRRLDADRPTLGVCLGAQLLAAAAGADVRPGGITELGFVPVDVEPGSPIDDFAGVRVLQWHGDTFDLPAGARRLATGQTYANQGFELGSALAVQFHPEVDGPMLEQWIASGVGELLGLGIDPRQLRADGQRYAEAQARAGERMVERWLDRVEASLAAPQDSARSEDEPLSAGSGRTR
ncbi:MAG TPA: glutamine amidotransferase [Naasia sp.]